MPDPSKILKAGANRRKIKDHIVAYSFTAPNFIGFGVFTLIPLAFAFILAFYSWNGSPNQEMQFIAFDNFVKLMGDAKFWRALWNTVLYTLGTVPLTMAAALGLAILLNQKVRGRNFFRSVAFFPYVASLVAVAAVWNYLFSPTVGPINNLLHSITGLPFKPPAGGGMSLPRWAADPNPYVVMFTVVFFSVWKNMGYYMVIYLAGLQGISQDLYEAADIDGASKWQKFWKITLPQLSPTTFFVLMILVINSFKVYDIFINIFAGADNQLTDNSRVLVYQIYNTAFRDLKFGYSSAMAMVLFVIVLGITLIQFQGEKKFTA
ncbi:MAG: sugar ABC transporter permease [Clostridiales bacterium]|jgi:multiple sugar transport system permease protein|nr:sugar ABC transporter permease [Clostridiales bacterium]